MRFFIANIMLSVLPPTRLFEFKRLLLNALGIRIGKGTSVCGGVRFYGGGNIVIGTSCWIGIDARFYSSPGADIIIGDNCDIAPRVVFMCGSHEIGGSDRRAGTGVSKPILVKSGCWLGVCTVALGGAVVGPSSVVAARSLLLGQEYGADQLFAGAPAIMKRRLARVED